jgi:hypothetical protein
MTKARNVDTLTPLERWLRKNNKSQCELAEAVGCHRQTIGKVNAGVPVEESVSLKVYFITGGAVEPPISRRGKPNLSTNPQRKK